ncbi:MAG: TIGR01777 family protein [Anaerolineales bacterium]|uniref:TIGR01777 family oxidoreductase n=1 Tax=Candidatus Villigracilis proximus TaxID=3140683 RepID=UPI003134F76F|nr:TIGR01777 family protein [Anaerolineales bacterium]
MNIMIAGGSGFLGAALAKSFLAEGHKVFILTRGSSVISGAQAVKWDAKTTNGWGHLVNEMDVMIHLTGRSLSSWPWTSKTKRDFKDSRIIPGLALAQAILEATQRPGIFIQASGINHYGLHGALADEATPPGDDFLARLTVQWEDATKSIEELGVRRVVLRSAVVLGKGEGLLSLMALPVKLFAGGPLGDGKFAMPWIHIDDWVGAVCYLIANENTSGAYNLIAPVPTSSADFYRALASVLHRPYWFPTPAFLLRILLGEMSVLVVEGRFAQPKRLIESGYKFQFEGPREALFDLLG